MFKLKRPCSECPFRTDVDFCLNRARKVEIANGLQSDLSSFNCHQTYDHPEPQLCAGYMVILAKTQQPSVAMRLGAACGEFDFDALDMEAPVYADFNSWIDGREESNGN